MQYPGSKSIGSVDNSAIYTLCHSKLPRDMTIVGTIHVGTPEYFATLQSHLDERTAKGAEIQYENSTFPSPQNLKTYPDWVQNRTHRLRKSLAKFTINQTPTGYVEQGSKEGIQYRATWQPHDLNRADLVLRFGRVSSEIVTKAVEEASRGYKVYESPAIAAAGLIMAAKGWRILRDERTNFALNAVDNTLGKNPATNLTLLWGADHLPGLVEGMVDRGYNVTNCVWVPQETTHIS
ncbi:hypothetical protein KDA06_00830 [Candidatus Saccharibacteria bacterium]|nr:hypothetical protein [Candidatus Saccharibacteria bacterium]HPR09430.1 hypothetical protein [Candidatus Saccharibacteria bacterium]